LSKIDLCSYNKSYKKSKAWIIERLVGYFEEKLLSEITSWHVEKYKAMRKEEILKRQNEKTSDIKQISMATVNRELACLQHMFSKCHQGYNSRPIINN